MRMSKQKMKDTARNILAAKVFDLNKLKRNKKKSAEDEIAYECGEGELKLLSRSFIMLGIVTAEEAEAVCKSKPTVKDMEDIVNSTEWMSATAKVRGTRFDG